jgi:hypothetical protein
VVRDARFHHALSRREILLLRQQSLALRSIELRLQMERDVMRLAPTLALVDRGISGLHWLRTHPQYPLGAAAVVALLRPRRALRWGMRLWWGWRSVRQALTWIDQRR